MADETKRSIWNFSAGPSQMPREILLKARSELINWKNTQSSVLEVSHRSKEYDQCIKACESNLRKMMNIPKNYKVIFMQGGATLQFACIPFNILKGKKKANYLVTGQWSTKAYEEAQKYCEVVPVIPVQKKTTTVPDPSNWKVDPDAAYFYYCENETVDGVEFHSIPELKNQLLVCDMSSNICSRPVDVSKFGVIYAGAQKNLGPAGVTIVIVREDLLDKNVHPLCPIMCNWKVQADNDSLYNTPPTFAIYMVNLYLEHMLALGGAEHYGKLNAQKAKLLYDAIDGSGGFYNNKVDKRFRSRMNVVFTIKDDEKIATEFVNEAKKIGLVELKGHRIVGGIRASIYNGMPLEAVEKLVNFMKEFKKKKESEAPKAKL
jgi:phosphoserine aminotransferase